MKEEKHRKEIEEKLDRLEKQAIQANNAHYEHQNSHSNASINDSDHHVNSQLHHDNKATAGSLHHEEHHSDSKQHEMSYTGVLKRAPVQKNVTRWKKVTLKKVTHIIQNYIIFI